MSYEIPSKEIENIRQYEEGRFLLFSNDIIKFIFDYSNLRSYDLDNCLISVTYTVCKNQLEITEINSYGKRISISILNSLFLICESIAKIIQVNVIIVDIHNERLTEDVLKRKGFTFKMNNQLGGTPIYEKKLE